MSSFASSFLPIFSLVEKWSTIASIFNVILNCACYLLEVLGAYVYYLTLSNARDIEIVLTDGGVRGIWAVSGCDPCTGKKNINKLYKM